MVRDAEGLSGPDVSLSHSGGYLAAATVGEGRVGIDVEVAGRRDRNWCSLAEAWLSDAEIRAVAAEGEAAFLAFWTLREAVAKLEEGGLAAALALDGAKVMAGRHGVCALDSGWAGHRQVRGVHLALAWRPDRCTSDGESLMIEALEAFRIHCMHSFVFI